jgi:uncharacterized membrane protein YoaK (UPF0700 family)
MTSSSKRKLKDKMQLGIMFSFAAGMVNVSSLVLFFSFTSNITGHYAILSSEIAKGNIFRIMIVLLWIGIYFSGSFLASLMQRARGASGGISVLPMIAEILCLFGVGLYGRFIYSETLVETELLVAVLLFAMGLQNGLTATVSGFELKTTHLTGLTTDMAINLSKLAGSRHDDNRVVKERLRLMVSIAAGYVCGGIAAGTIVHYSRFMVFVYVAGAMIAILVYNLSRSYSVKETHRRQRLGQRLQFGAAKPSSSGNI